jgi:hypothetical protein
MTTSASAAAQGDKAPTAVTSWAALNPAQEIQAKETLEVWPLDEFNAKLLNEVHPLGYLQSNPEPHDEYDLVGTRRPRRSSCLFRVRARKPIAWSKSPG